MVPRIALDTNQEGARELIQIGRQRADAAASYGRKISVEQAVNELVEKWLARAQQEAEGDTEGVEWIEELLEVDGLTFYFSGTDEKTKRVVRHEVREAIHAELTKPKHAWDPLRIDQLARRVLLQTRMMVWKLSDEDMSQLREKVDLKTIADRVNAKMEKEYPALSYRLDPVRNISSGQ